MLVIVVVDFTGVIVDKLGIQRKIITVPTPLQGSVGRLIPHGVRRLLVLPVQSVARIQFNKFWEFVVKVEVLDNVHGIHQVVRIFCKIIGVEPVYTGSAAIVWSMVAFIINQIEIGEGPGIEDTVDIRVRRVPRIRKLGNGAEG